MDLYRIDITSWTASFRYPNLISGVQPTLEVPPLSTVLGLINASAGRYLNHSELEIGYYFEFAAKEFDLETIYQVSSDGKGNPSNNAKSNIMRREFLFENKLSIYLKDKELVDYLSKPYFSLLLGRSNDLATIKSIEQIVLQKTESANKIKGQIIPLDKYFLPGKIQALPTYFSNDLPRLNLGTKAFSVIPFFVRDFSTTITGFRDGTQGKDGVDIFFHQLNSTIYD